MDQNILLIALMFIYLLILVNLFIFLITLIIKIIDKVRNYQYQKTYKKVIPYIEAYMQNEKSYSRRLYHREKKLENQVVLDILLSYSKNNEKSIVDKFEGLGYIDELIKNAEKELTLELVKTLAIIRSHKFFPVLIKGINSNDYELKYYSYYALSLLHLQEKQVESYVGFLLSSGIMRDRLIEMMNNLELSTSLYVDFLEKEQTELGKVVYLRVLKNKLDVQDEKLSDKLVKFLFDTKEVRIATVVALTSTNNNKYFNMLAELYPREESWEVRAAMAKSIGMLSDSESIGILRKMIYDSNWWVRFNAAEVLATKGLDGIDALIDISLSSEDDGVSDLAYYMLNANQSVNSTIIEIKEEYYG